MPRIRSFPPIADAAARVLIVGSMPGAASLRAGRYYAHPQNAFWPLLGALLGFDPQSPYAQRVQRLRAAGIALWDVLGHCERTGSLDSAIDLRTAQANDFAAFLVAHPRIAAVFCNGAAAFTAWRRVVAPSLRAPLPVMQLPSTSPAHASLSRAAKLGRWRVVVDALAVPAGAAR